eukprot:CAMPEP_0118662448 /NCGR_PEP_ID=MMETSP0785-20121206/16838_1 /TAXON_ID=91992 /ORGANISM="Bolidomonas pacifica, Strain CCMP 1866" /LENGTH=191 /DNA_ID=CAMNT_0006555995 /DNA_START=399 /DNA_END=971 /DNA_ORIENTATION=+
MDRYDCRLMLDMYAPPTSPPSTSNTTINITHKDEITSDRASGLTSGLTSDLADPSSSKSAPVSNHNHPDTSYDLLPRTPPHYDRDVPLADVHLMHDMRYGGIKEMQEKEKERKDRSNFRYIPTPLKSSTAWASLLTVTDGEGITKDDYDFMVKTARASVRSEDVNIFELKLGVKGDCRFDFLEVGSFRYGV